VLGVAPLGEPVEVTAADIATVFHGQDLDVSVAQRAIALGLLTIDPETGAMHSASARFLEVGKELAGYGVPAPVGEGDLAMFRRFATEPHLIGPDWAGFRDAQQFARRYAADGHLGADGGRLMVDADGQAADFVTHHAGRFGGPAG
jgi:hypothetical protein